MNLVYCLILIIVLACLVTGAGFPASLAVGIALFVAAQLTKKGFGWLKKFIIWLNKPSRY